MCRSCVMKYGVLEIKTILRRTDVDVATIGHKAHKSITNFNSVSAVLIETLIREPCFPLSNVCRTPP